MPLYADGTDDYAERVYVWGSVIFEIADSVKFVVNADGSREIRDFAVIPMEYLTEREIFDFESGSVLAQRSPRTPPERQNGGVYQKDRHVLQGKDSLRKARPRDGHMRWAGSCETAIG